MRIVLLILLMLSAATVAADTTLYRWVDEQGRVHYSDQPQANSQEIKISAPSSFDPGAARQQQTQRPPPSAQTDKPAAFAGYESIAITAPTPDQVLWNIGGILTLNVSLKPALQPGHQIGVTYNGTEVQDWPPGATSSQIRDVYRGTHTVAVFVVDEAGNRVASGAPVTFYVKQTSRLLN